MNLKHFTLLLALFFVGFTAQSQTVVNPLITSDQVWTAAGSPYLINQNSFIDSGVTVTVMPGAEVIGSGSYRKIDIDGAFNILGNRDSMATLSGLQYQYSATSAEHYRAVNSNLTVQFAKIKGIGVGQRIFQLRGGIDVIMQNSVLDSGYYDIYYQSDYTHKGNVVIDSCEIYGIYGTYNQGLIIYTIGDNVDFTITNSIIGKARSVNLEGDFYLEGNTFTDLTNVNLGRSKGNVQVTNCNLFTDAGDITFKFNGNAGMSDMVQFTNNTIDSLGESELAINVGLYGSDSMPAYLFKNNNFQQTGRKISVSGSNSDPLTVEQLTMGDNYWGTTDTNAIHASVKDYRDNININGKVVFTNVLPAPVIGCPVLINPCPTANFSYVILSDELFIVDSTDADSTFTRIWSFGDGNMDTTTGGSVYHVYSTLDTFDVWLHMYSPTGTLCDSMMVTVIASGSYFVEPSFTQAIDTNIAYNIFVVDESENVTASTTYSWDFGDGQSSSDRLPSHHYANFGKYALCLTLTDSGQTKTFCDSIGMNESGDVLKADGFTINVIKLASEPQRIEPQVLNVFPNPTKGNVSVYFNAPRNADYTVSLVSLLGETIALETNNLHAGKQHLKLDLTNYKTGIYYLRVQSESVNYSTRVSLIK